MPLTKRGRSVTKILWMMLWLGVGIWAIGVQAKTQYVTDSLQITMRSGQSNGHKILRMLPSGTPVEVLSENGGSGYSRVRALGEEGWVLTRQLMNDPSAREQLEGLKERLQTMRDAPEDTRNRLAALLEEYKALQQSYAQVNEARQRLEQELASIRRVSADAVRINTERTELRKAVADLTREREDLRQEIRDADNQTSQRWFLIGGGVALAGILLGLILPHVRLQRRKSSWSTL
jgi:SH3 domain protein